jgi:hypothetical protein
MQLNYVRDEDCEMLYCAASKSYLIYGDTRHNEESDIEDLRFGGMLWKIKID